MMLAQSYLPVIGGIERHVHNLSRELLRRGHDVAVCTLAIDDLPSYGIEDGIPVHRLPGWAGHLASRLPHEDRPHAAPVPDPGTILALHRFLKHQPPPDIVHAHDWLAASYLPLRSRSAPLVLTLHDYSFRCATSRAMEFGQQCPGPSPLRCLRCAGNHYGKALGAATAVGNALMQRARCRRIDAFIAVSPAVAKWNLLTSITKPAHVIPNFIPAVDDLTAASGGPVPPGLPSAPYVLFVGDLSRDKGVDVLVEAHHKLGYCWDLVAIGRPIDVVPEQRGVHVYPGWEHRDVLAAMANAAVVVAPSVWSDPCPTVVLEAMALGKAVITTSTGGMVDMITPDKTGVLVPPGDPCALASAIKRLMEDDDEREALGRLARVAAEPFTAGAVVSRIEDVYEQSVARHRGQT